MQGDDQARCKEGRNDYEKDEVGLHLTESRAKKPAT
jgi:hypothetical protein